LKKSVFKFLFLSRLFFILIVLNLGHISSLCSKNNSYVASSAINSN